jgi:hypothetical protein
MLKNWKEYIKELKEREAYYSDCVENAELVRSISADNFRKTLDDIRNELMEAENMSLLKKIRF